VTNFVTLFAVALLVTAVVTPIVARLAWRLGAIDEPGPRKVHDRPTPRLGGLAMLVGFVAALGVAWLLSPGDPVLAPVFDHTSEPMGLLLGALAISAVGVVDDMRELSVPTKLAGQILAALLPVLAGIQLVHVWVPGLGVVSLAPDLGVPLTVLAIVAMVNAVNMIDGLDGLAAGIVAIGSIAFFAFAYGSQSMADAAPTVATIAVAALAGVSIGFLIHNFHPASIFMGDTGSMLLGLLLATAGVSFVGRTTDPGYLDFAGVFPLLIPALVLAVAFVDTAFAIGRRLRDRRRLGEADRDHLHHRLFHSGLGQRRTVLVLYYWSAVAAFGAVGVTYLPTSTVSLVAGGLAVLGAALTVGAVRRGQTRQAASP
jgi:UDP-GlcNAc:undecaprenyl-phosphate/decaprenyl-phosphate GlcNAc-1-phosphate transferase